MMNVYFDVICSKQTFLYKSNYFNNDLYFCHNLRVCLCQDIQILFDSSK